MRSFCRERLVPYKVPKTFEFVQSGFRDESGKMRRTQLATSRNASVTSATAAPHNRNEHTS